MDKHMSVEDGKELIVKQIEIDDPRFYIAIMCGLTKGVWRGFTLCRTATDDWSTLALHELCEELARARAKPRSITATFNAGDKVNWEFEFDSPSGVNKVSFTADSLPDLEHGKDDAKGASFPISIRYPDPQKIEAIAFAGLAFSSYYNTKWSVQQKSGSLASLRKMLKRVDRPIMYAKRKYDGPDADCWTVRFSAGNEETFIIYEIRVPKNHPFDQGDPPFDFSRDAS